MDNFTRDDILYLNNSMEQQKPISLDSFLIGTKVFCLIAGVPLNMFLAIIIIRIRRLRTKTRNIFLLGITLSNVFVFVPAIIELVYSLAPYEFLCEAYVATVGLPYALLLSNLLFALIDRCVAITYPLWHKKWITVRNAKCLLVLSAVSLTVLTKFVYVLNIFPLRCEVRLAHSKTIGFTTASLFLLCFVVHVIVYRKTMSLLCPSRTLRSSSTKVKTAHGNLATVVVSNTVGNQHLCEWSSDVKDKNPSSIFIVNPRGKINVAENESDSSMNIHVNGNTVLQMEIGATRALIFGVTSLFIMAGPVIIFFLTVFILHMVLQYDCSNLMWLASYAKEMGLLHSVYNPFVIIFKNNELHTIVKSVINTWSQKQRDS